jgi:mono/diheme cytochrome c family protein
MIRAAIRGWLRQPTVSPFMVKAFLVGALGTAIGVPLALVAVPYIDFFNDMAVQPKVKPQMVWKLDGAEPTAGDRSPAPGSLPVGHFEYPFPTPPELLEPLRESDDARRERVSRLDDFQAHAARELEAAGPDIPPPFVPALPSLDGMKLGQKQFNTICVVCHGDFGVGNGRVASRGFPAPANLLGARVRAFPDAQIFHVVTTGRNAMPSYARQLAPPVRWAVAHYVRALQLAFPPRPEPSAPPLPGVVPPPPPERPTP